MSTKLSSNRQIKRAHINARVKTMTDQSIRSLKNSGLTQGNFNMLAHLDTQITNICKFTDREFDACETESDIDILLRDKKARATAFVNTFTRAMQNSLRNNLEKTDAHANAKKEEKKRMLESLL